MRFVELVVINGPPSCGKTLLMKTLQDLIKTKVVLTELSLKSSSYRILQLDIEQYFKKGPGLHSTAHNIFELSQSKLFH